MKVAHEGLRGNDFAEFVKRASHPQALWIRANPPKPGEVYVHSHIFSTTDVAGANRNHDAYSREMARNDLPSYVKYGRAYRNHVNGNPDKAMGVVKNAYLNEQMGRAELIAALNATKEAAERNKGVIADRTLDKLARHEDVAVSQSCFPPGELVLMADGSQKPIEQVGHGDYVVTHLGNKKAVQHQATFHHDGVLVRFKASGIPGIVSATDDHQIWVREDKAKAAEGWRRADTVRAGDYIRTPFDTSVGSQGDIDYAIVLGYYAAEGSIYEYHRGLIDADWRQGVDFTFGHTEKRYADRVVDRIKKFGGVTVTAGVPKSRKTCYHVRVSGCELRRRIEADAGRYSYGKKFSDEVMRWAPETQLILLGVFFDGDGTWNKINQNLCACTVSEVMATQLVTMCWRNGIPAILNRIHSPSHQKAGKRPHYTIQVAGRDARRIPTDKIPDSFQYTGTSVCNIGHLKHQAADRVVTRKVGSALTYVEGNYAYHRVMKVSTEHYVGPVHTFGVADDESYVVRLVAVKNCKVPYDRCSACGNEAKNRAEYCDEFKCTKYGGCKNNLGRVFEDGHHLHVDNPKCQFFDFSDVSDTRGADRTAFITGKVASADRNIGGAELAERLGLVPPDHLLDPHVIRGLSALRKLAAFKATYPKDYRAPEWHTIKDVRAKIAHVVPVSVQTAIQFAGDPHKLIADWGGMGVILPPDIWLSTLTNTPIEKCAALFVGGVDPRILIDHPSAADYLSGAPAIQQSERTHYLTPTPTAHGRETQLAALQANSSTGKLIKSARVGNPPPPHVVKEAQLRYLAYVGSILGAFENSAKLSLLQAEVIRHTNI